MSYPELQGLSNALAALTADIAHRIIAVQGSDGREMSGFIWRTGLAVTAHEALEGEDEVAGFDLDMTLIDTRPGFARGARRARRILGAHGACLRHRGRARLA